jgi:hypothetical protein
MTSLDRGFITQAQGEPQTVTFNGTEYTFQATRAVRFVANMSVRATLEVVDPDGTVVGYVISDGGEAEAIPERIFDAPVAAALVRTVEDALAEITR